MYCNYRARALIAIAFSRSADRIQALQSESKKRAEYREPNDVSDAFIHVPREKRTRREERYLADAPL